jgi:hypothetical protein
LYKILVDDNIYELESQVITHMSNGWIPQGGVSSIVLEVDKDEYVDEAKTVRFMQAMVRNDELNSN